MKLWQGILTGVLFGLIAGAVIWLIIAPPRGEPLTLSPQPTAAPIIVHIAGAVLHPGVYNLARESRVEDAVNAAGGFTADADQDHVNLAAPLDDGIKINILSIQQATAAQISVPPGNLKSGTLDPSADGRININTATLEQLDTLPGVGEGKAAAIIVYREKNGSFQAIEDITNVPGIGEGIFTTIKEFICVNC